MHSILATFGGSHLLLGESGMGGGGGGGGRVFRALKSKC